MHLIRTVFSSALALALAGGTVSAADLRDMKVLEDDSGTRAVLSLQGASEYTLFTLQNPDRLVLDLKQSRLAPGFRMPPPNGSIANVRAGKPVAGTLRVVFDLAQAVETRSHIERDGDNTRLIVDLLSRNRASETATATMSAAMAPVRPAPREAAANFEQDRPQQLEVDRVFAEAAAMPAPSMAVSQPPARTPPPLGPPAVVHIATGRPPMVVATPAAPAARVPVKTVHSVMGNGQRKLVVAIDAGHGGKDPGAQGPTGVREKAVTLAVARELARQVNADQGMRAVLIRDGDSFVPLQQRYMKARAAQADLFISIHADASPNNTASGASVFVLSTRGASSQAARWLADKENAADLVGGVSLYQKDHNLAAVLLDLSQSATMRASDDIANQVLGSLKNVGKAHKPSIERANFVVLRSPDVPSMLIETGFITNPSEEQRLNDPGYRSRLAQAITEGVRRYFTDQAPAGSWYASRGVDSPLALSSP